MIQKVEGSFYETYSNRSEGIPSIQITNKNFYGGFALGQTPFIDETIYYPKLEFWRGERIGGEWSWTSKDLELVRCQLDYFDPKYWDLFRDKPLNDLYCIKDLNETLEGYQHERTYSFFFVTLHSCHNKTKNGNDCKPKEVIDQAKASAASTTTRTTPTPCPTPSTSPASSMMPIRWMRPIPATGNCCGTRNTAAGSSSSTIPATPSAPPSTASAWM